MHTSITLFCLLASVFSMVFNVSAGVFFRGVNAVGFNNDVEARAVEADSGAMIGDKVKMMPRDLTTVFVTVTIATCTESLGTVESTTTQFTTSIVSTVTSTVPVTPSTTPTFIIPPVSTKASTTTTPPPASTTPVPPVSLTTTPTTETSISSTTPIFTPPTTTTGTTVESSITSFRPPTSGQSTSTTTVTSSIPQAPSSSGDHVKSNVFGVIVGFGLVALFAVV